MSETRKVDPSLWLRLLATSPKACALALAHAIALVLLVSFNPAADAQSVLQAGPAQPGHVPIYVGSGYGQVAVQDSGTAAGGGPGLGLSELLLTIRGTGTPPYANAGTGPDATNSCNYDAPITNATGYHYLCMSPNAQGGGLIAYGAGGGATALPFQFIINGLPITPEGSTVLQPGQILGNYTSTATGGASVNWMASGSTVPSWLTPYQLFTNTASGPASDAICIWDKADCDTWATLDESTHQVTLTPYALSGTIAGSSTFTGTLALQGNDTFSGNNILSGNNSFSGTNTHTGTENVSGTLNCTGSCSLSGSVAITGLSTPVNASDAATKEYVDNSAAGLTPHTQVVYATATALAANTYNNGSSGVGATLTGNADGAVTIDGNTPTTGERVLIKNEATAANNGIYTVTTVGSGSAAYVLTRATDADTPGTGNPDEIGFGTYVFVTSGTANANSGWSVNSTVTTIGLSAINWTQFSAQSGVSTVSNSDGSLSVSPTSGAVVAGLNLSHSNTWSAEQIFKGNTPIGGGDPWVDVKSGANGCAAAVGDGSTNDYSAISCQISYMQTTYQGGYVFFPCGNYVIGSTLAVSAPVTLVGEGVACTQISTNNTDLLALDFYNSGAQQHWGGLRDLAVTCYENAAATEDCVEVDNFVNLTFENFQIWGGEWALYLDGVRGSGGGSDNTFRNGFINGYGSSGGGILSYDAADWFYDIKDDTSGNTAGWALSLQTDASASSVEESDFFRIDMSGNYTNGSIGVNDATAGRTTAMFFHPIVGGSGGFGALGTFKHISLIGAELGTGSVTVTDGNLAVVGSTAGDGGGGSITFLGGGTRACSGNIGVNC